MVDRKSARSAGGELASAGEGIGAFTYLAATFVGMLVIANVIAVKPMLVLGQIVPAGVLTYAVTFLVTDTVSEVWGTERTRRLVWAGLVISLLVALFVRIAIWAPAVPFWDGAAAYAEVLEANLRIVVASMVAYLVSQFHDLWAFAFWRRVTKGRHLWLRNSASTLVSQFIDTFLFVSIAFLGVWGGWSVIWTAILGQYLIKVIIALIDTPLVYLTVRWVRARIAAEKEEAAKEA